MTTRKTITTTYKIFIQVKGFGSTQHRVGLIIGKTPKNMKTFAFAKTALVRVNELQEAGYEIYNPVDYDRLVERTQ
jgi:hypothetical protein